jgi:transcriptional regulator with XRE-family HTH domain
MDSPTDRQVRAARALLGWTQIELAEHALVAESVVKRIESGRAVRSATLRAIRDTLTKAGISFICTERECGVTITRDSGGGVRKRRDTDLNRTPTTPLSSAAPRGSKTGRPA